MAGATLVRLGGQQLGGCNIGYRGHTFRQRHYALHRSRAMSGWRQRVPDGFDEMTRDGHRISKSQVQSGAARMENVRSEQTIPHHSYLPVVRIRLHCKRAVMPAVQIGRIDEPAEKSAAQVDVGVSQNTA